VEGEKGRIRESEIVKINKKSKKRRRNRGGSGKGEKRSRFFRIQGMGRLKRIPTGPFNELGGGGGRGEKAAR